MSVTSLTTITHVEYNDTYTLMEEVLGLGENGWGIPLLSSAEVLSGKRVLASNYNNLLKDINVAHRHITNAATSTSAVITGTTIISASYINELSSVSTWLHDNSRRYTCHPNQYFLVDLVGGGNTATIVAPLGTSTRTLAWGANDVVEIEHHVTCGFRSRLAARYYFNQGNYLTWRPYYNTGSGFVNDLDAEWANFIDYLNEAGNEYRYGRTEYLAGDSTTAYTSGTLYINVIANRSDDQARVDFTIQYGNVATPNLLISPAVGVYNITL